MFRCALPLSLSLTLASGAFAAVPTERAESIARTYLAEKASGHGLTTGDLVDSVVTDIYATAHNGVTHVYLQQRHEGIPVYGGLFNLNISRDGEVFHVGNRFVPNLSDKVNAPSPALRAEDALMRAAESLGLPASRAGVVRLETLGGPQKKARFAPSGISRDEIPAELVWEPTLDGRVRLAWLLVVDQVNSSDWWEIRIDAETGEALGGSNRTVSDTWAASSRSARSTPVRSRIATPEAGQPRSSSYYDVIPLGAADPLDVGETLVRVFDPADPTASPSGWHDDGSSTYTDTQGNNVDAKDDLAGDNEATIGSRVDGGAGLNFAEEWTPGSDPDGDNLPAAIVNLFYYNNIMHDVSFHYGFDEAAGNFQQTNFTRGGAGNDAVRADAQDGAEAAVPEANNANFSTPPDGGAGRMQMFRWTSPRQLEVPSGGAAGTYAAGAASFGGFFSVDSATMGDVVYAADGTPPANDGCEEILDDLTGKIGMIDRGACDFALKVFNVQEAGGVGAIVVNDGNCSGTPCSNGTLTMGADDPPTFASQIDIPSLMIGQDDGDTIKTELDARAGRATVTATLANEFADRDSDFDNGVIGHEYGHGISNRLTGGPSTASCLNTCLNFPTCSILSEQAGEGWSDFWTLVLSTLPSDTPSTSRGVGNYLIYQDRTGGGIRPAPYSTDPDVNSLTYGMIDDGGAITIPHGVGTVWMSMLWDLHWELVARYGYDEDLYAGSGGNNLFIQLVMDGMKMQACSPTFVDARDGILAADAANNSGAHECEIWRAFANRGVGENADGGTFVIGNETEDFTLPAQCAGTLPNYLFDDGFESGDTSRW